MNGPEPNRVHNSPAHPQKTPGSGNLLNTPAPSLKAEFKPEFGRRSLLTIDTEEEFDWRKPFRRDGYRLDHLERIDHFQRFCENLDVSPVYLVDWPVAQSPLAQEVLGAAAQEGRAEIGIQLHSWVNPPFEEEVSTHNSFAGNLPAGLEAEKFNRLADAIESKFGVIPQIFRSGRYGLGPNSAAMLKARGIKIDSSVRPLHDFSPQGGPDFTNHPLTPYWSDADRDLLELPLTSAYWGLLRKQGRILHGMLGQVQRAGGLFSRLGLLERIALTPEGVTKQEALRGIDISLDDGLDLLVLSLHSPSIAPGYTPYVQSEEDVEILYDWLRGIYGYLQLRGVRPTTVGEIATSVVT